MIIIVIMFLHLLMMLAFVLYLTHSFNMMSVVMVMVMMMMYLFPAARYELQKVFIKLWKNDRYMVVLNRSQLIGNDKLCLLYSIIV
jgi:hypothetical protein